MRLIVIRVPHNPGTSAVGIIKVGKEGLYPYFAALVSKATNAHSGGKPTLQPVLFGCYLRIQHWESQTRITYTDRGSRITSSTSRHQEENNS